MDDMNLPENLTVVGNALNIGLPKWPALTVTGKKVTEQQATEILLRTDSNMPDFSYACNDRRFNEDATRLFGIPESPSFYNSQEMSDEEKEARNKAFRDRWVAMDNLRAELGIVGLSYLWNARIASAYIGGPHGWCNWDGTIFSNSNNIGKWPSVEEVARDWCAIAESFPYLELQSQLYSGESSEDYSEPVVTFTVKDGHVTVEPANGNTVVPAVGADIHGFALGIVMGTRNELGVTVGMLREKIESVYGEVPQFKMPND